MKNKRSMLVILAENLVHPVWFLSVPSVFSVVSSLE